MNLIHKLANRRAILSATREDMKLHRAKARDARRGLLQLMEKVASDPAHAHLHYSEVGRLYITSSREDTLADLAYGSSLTLLSEIYSIQDELKKQ